MAKPHISLQFNDPGDFCAMRNAEQFLLDRKFSYAPLQRGAPRGIMFGNYYIAKWRNLTPGERDACHGVMTGNNAVWPGHRDDLRPCAGRSIARPAACSIRRGAAMTPSRILDRAMASTHSGSCPPRDEHAMPPVPSATPSAAPERALIREALREAVRTATIAELLVLFACLIAPALILFVGE